MLPEMCLCHGLWTFCKKRKRAPDVPILPVLKLKGKEVLLGEPPSDSEHESPLETPSPLRKPLLLRRVSSMERRVNRWLDLVHHKIQTPRAVVVGPRTAESRPF
jgi:hypothetical protein